MGGGDLGPTPGHQQRQVGGPLGAQIETGAAEEFIPGPTGIHPQSERGHLAGTTQGRQRLGELLGPTSLLELFAVEHRVGPVARTQTAHPFARTRAQTIAVAPTPIAHIVAAGEGRDPRFGLGPIDRLADPTTTGEVGDLISGEAGFGHPVVEHLVLVGRQIVIHIALTGLELLVERGVLLVDHLVATEVFRPQRQGLVESSIPDIHRLAGDREHEVDVHIVEARLPEDVVTAKHHVAAVDPTQAVQQGLVERLDAHRNAVHPELPQERRLVGRHGGRIAFDTELRGPAQPQPVKGGQHRFPLLEREQRWGAPAEKDRLGPAIRSDELQLADECLDIPLDKVTRGRAGIEGAILALVRTKRHMHVQRLDRRAHGPGPGDPAGAVGDPSQRGTAGRGRHRCRCCHRSAGWRRRLT